MSERSGGELELIEWIRGHAPAAPHVPLGIGDDAALVRNAGGPDTLVTTDLLMDGVHFELASTDPRLIGRKALAVNLSDAAAMAGVPRAAFVSFALPKSGGRALGERLTDGIQQLAGEFDVVLAGGDTNTWNGPLVINITLLAEPAGDGPVLRSGALPGDRILVTGALGGSLSGRHLTFTPRVSEALKLREAVRLHALIDLSDGLATDLRHVLRASGAGAIIGAAAIPVHPDVDHDLPQDQRVDHALRDGEDFELLFTVDADDARRLRATPPFDTPLSEIGEVTTVAGELLLRREDGRSELIRQAGWEHGFDV